ncbi:hypothetical protein GXW74_11625 [Roseomonas eburnea]|uniref:Uncharacterized protein n=1 Tax=Neoroseomonas eburnea TaxID=1346889 RepID=A0A9X9XBQ2_9PROT|nr:hypothetical protein [Neoroseomonas eburnea]MBR0681138.1 hypothetical protein [Neoroseomonas eburnea]
MADPALGKSVEALLGYDDEALLKELAMRARGAQFDPAIAGAYQPDVAHEFPDMGLADDLLDLGGRILRRWERELHAVVCGTAKEDAEDRKTILAQIGADDAALGAALGAVLVGMGASAAVAVVLAAFILKRILKPAGQEACKKWSERLGTG